MYEDEEFRNFITRESAVYYNSINDNFKGMQTNFAKIIALSQYGQIHEISLYAATKKEFKTVRYVEEVMKQYPIIKKLAIKHGINPKTVILVILTTILSETQDMELEGKTSKS
ncbi:hypothetical protein [Metabacillus litoralis]|uniref:hypothetical protein n=1 Tax=Metabacillus litoralis TaxID=152268 RepID=UPI00203EE7AD|nr:hypothetical protein [Metabacillus litoralis]MCM3412660.1 hypothetical protein [Metabacillus litoralis]